MSIYFFRIIVNNLQNYNFYSNSPTQTKGGGVGFYVRSSTMHWHRRDLSVFYEGCLEAIFVEMLVGKSHVICGTIYRPSNQPGIKNKLFLEKFEDLFNNFLNKV